MLLIDIHLILVYNIVTELRNGTTDGKNETHKVRPRQTSSDN